MRSGSKMILAFVSCDYASRLIRFFGQTLRQKFNLFLLFAFFCGHGTAVPAGNRSVGAIIPPHMAGIGERAERLGRGNPLRCRGHQEPDMISVQQKKENLSQLSSGRCAWGKKEEKDALGFTQIHARPLLPTRCLPLFSGAFSLPRDLDKMVLTLAAHKAIPCGKTLRWLRTKSIAG